MIQPKGSEPFQQTLGCFFRGEYDDKLRENVKNRLVYLKYLFTKYWITFIISSTKTIPRDHIPCDLKHFICISKKWGHLISRHKLVRLKAKTEWSLICFLNNLILLIFIINCTRPESINDKACSIDFTLPRTNFIRGLICNPVSCFTEWRINMRPLSSGIVLIYIYLLHPTETNLTPTWLISMPLSTRLINLNMW